MKIPELFKTTNFNNSLLLGFYGGGNFGDELLLEVLLNKFSLEKYKDIKVLNLGQVDFEKYHFLSENIEAINIKKSKWRFLIASLSSENIVVGGGGLWGLDVNLNILIFSLYLFVMRFIFLKKVFLIGVGFYNSTTRLGRWMGWMAGKSANVIIARDRETFQNFNRISKDKVFLDKDIVFYLEEFLDKDRDLEKEIEKIRKHFISAGNSISPSVLLVNRRFKGGKGDRYRQLIEKWAKDGCSGLETTLSIMESREMDVKEYAAMEKISQESGKACFDFSFNPLAFYFFLKRYGANVIIVAPQYHVQLVAYLAGAPFMPISYDNKCKELFQILGINKFYEVGPICYEDIADFISSKRNVEIA